MESSATEEGWFDHKDPDCVGMWWFWHACTSGWVHVRCDRCGASHLVEEADIEPALQANLVSLEMASIAREADL